MIRALGDRARRVASAVPRGALTAAAESRLGGPIALGADATPPPSSSAINAAVAAASRAARGRKSGPSTRPVNVQEATRPLYANMIVERLPWVMPEPPAWETEYRAWSEARGARFLKELPEELVNPKGEFEETESDAEAAFEPADRVTDADRSGDVRTLHRKLDQFLFLVVQDRATGQWGFPREVNDETGKTIRESAKAAMDAAVGDSIETFLVGNAPLGHWEERRAGGPPATASGEPAKNDGAAESREGARVEGGGEGTNFYLRAQWLDGDLRLEQRYKDFMWLTKVRRAGRAAPSLRSPRLSCSIFSPPGLFLVAALLGHELGSIGDDESRTVSLVFFPPTPTKRR